MDNGVDFLVEYFSLLNLGQWSWFASTDAGLTPSQGILGTFTGLTAFMSNQSAATLTVPCPTVCKFIVH